MASITSILVPTDFSPESNHALAYARQLAETFGASLHLLHVVENPFAPGAFMEMYTPPPGDYVSALEREAQARLDALLTEEERARNSAAVAVRTGAPAQEILENLQAHPAIDLLVMATAGRGGVARMMMGSVADRMVRSAPCPVLTIHSHDVDGRGAGHRAA